MVKSFNFSLNPDLSLTRYRDVEKDKYKILRQAFKQKVKGVTAPPLRWRMKRPLGNTEHAPKWDGRCIYMSPCGIRVKSFEARAVRDFVQVAADLF